MKLNYKDPIYWFAVLAMAAIMLWQCESGKNDKLHAEIENSRLRQENARLLAVIDTTNRQIQRVSTQRDQDTKIFMAEKAAYQGKIDAARRSRIVITRQLQPIVDSVAIVREYVSQTDSLLDHQDRLINTMYEENERMGDSFRKEIGLLNQQITAQAAISDLYRKTAEQKTTQLRRETRRKKFWRSVATVGGVAVGILLIGR